MKLATRLAALAAVTMIGAPAFAQVPPPPAPPSGYGYERDRDSRDFALVLGGGLSSLVYELDGASTNPSFGTFQVRGGVVLNEYLSVMAQAHVAYAAYEWDDFDIYDSTDFELNKAYGIYLEPRLPIGPLGLHGRLGWFESEIDDGFSIVEAKGPAYGIGVDLDIESVTLTADIEVYNLDFNNGATTNTGDGASFTIALQNRF